MSNGLTSFAVLRTLLVAVVASVLALGALQAPASAATTRTLSISASSTGAVVNKSVAISGVLSKSPKGSAVIIQRKSGSTWVTAKITKTTTSGGKYSTRVTVPGKTGAYSYRAVATAQGSLKKATSKTLTISALAPVTATLKATPKELTAGSSATVSGSVKPFVTNTTVTIQHFVNSKWISTGFTTKLTSKGTFKRSIVIKNGSVLRVFVPRAGLKASAVSPTTADSIVVANPKISSTSLPNGAQGSAYSAQLAQVGSNPGTWSVTPTLPNGLTLNSKSGRITGKPLAPSSKDYTFKFAQPGLTTATKVLKLTITTPVPPPPPTPPTISTTALPDGQRGTAYTATLQAQNNPSGTWTATPLPAGLSLTGNTISGTPTAAGTTNVTIVFTQTSTGLPSAPKVLPLKINPSPGPSILTTSLPNGRAGGTYEAFLQATGGPGTWSKESGSLPPLYNLDPDTGRISGNTSVFVTRDTTYRFTVGFSNADGVATPVELSITILTSGNAKVVVESRG